MFRRTCRILLHLTIASITNTQSQETKSTSKLNKQSCRYTVRLFTYLDLLSCSSFVRGYSPKTHFAKRGGERDSADKANPYSLGSTDLPPVKPSAIALGTFFNHGIELAVLSPVFGQTYHRAKLSNTKEEFIKSKETTTAAVAWGTSFVGSALQSYGVGALINATGTLSYKGAAYLGSLIFAATAAPGVSFAH